jgi:predicted transcriptional regulator
VGIGNPVLSDLSVLSGDGMAVCAEPPCYMRPAILAALRAGPKTPGSISTAAKLGATDTYQEIERMVANGLLSIQPNGALSLTAAANLEATT